MVLKNTKIYLLAFVMLLLESQKILQGQNTTSYENENVINQKIETIAENSDEQLDYSSILDDLNHFKQNPICINYASYEKLKKLMLLNDLQINNLITYIYRYGNLVSIFEFQAIDGFNSDLIFAMLPYITITKKPVSEKVQLTKLTKKGRNQFILRYRQVLERKQKYSDPNNSGQTNNNTQYSGSPQNICFKYRYAYFDKIKLGLTAEKDAGEEFFKGSQKQGFDFYSAFLFLKNIYKIKSLVIGDYRAQFGQGLCVWSGLAFGKSSDVLNIKKYARGIRPYTSTNETDYFRGAGVTVELKQFEITLYYSNKKIDVSINEIDSSANKILFFNSFRESGYHRTASEIENKNNAREINFGCHLDYKMKKIKFGFTALKTQFDAKMTNKTSPVNQFEFNGDQNTNLGFDYSCFLRNMIFFGEAARSNNGGIAVLNGIIVNINPLLSFSLLYRNYSKEYQGLKSNAFGVNSSNINEKGLYIGMVAGLHSKWTLSAYVDNFRSLWLKYQTSAPSKGDDYLLQLDYFLSKNTQMYFRYRNTKKQINSTIENNIIDYLNYTQKQSLRFHIIYTISPSFIFRNRFEFLINNIEENSINQAFIIYQDIKYRPVEKKYGITFRYALFETDSYNERIYAYENNVLGAFSIPAYYYKGSRIYLLLSYRFSRRFHLWLRFAQTYYSNRNTIGANYERIDGNVKSEINAQVRISL